MKNLLVKLIIFVFFTTSTLVFSQTREGQVVSGALSLGYGKSVALPQGEWSVVKIGYLPGNNATHIGYLLESKDKNDGVTHLLVQDSRTPNYWNSSFYSLPNNALEVERYSTTDSMWNTKISFFQILKKDDQKNFSILGMDFEKYTNDTSKSFVVSHARLINKREAVWYRSLIRLPKSDSNELNLSSSVIGVVKKFNNDLIDSISLSFNEKKPQNAIYFDFVNPGQAVAQVPYKEKPTVNMLSTDQVMVSNVNKEKSDNNISDSVRPFQSDTSPSQKNKADELVKLQLQMSALKAELEKDSAGKSPYAVVKSSNRRALVIGNNKYLNVGKLENAAEDASAMAKSLKDLGFDVTVKTDLVLKEMNASIRNFKTSIKQGDEVIFFYAGHGVQIGQTNFLLPIDIAGESEDQIRDDAVLLDRVLDDISEKKAKFTLAMLDACRDNPFKKSGRNIGGGARGLAPASTANGQMIIFSAGAGQLALDKLGPGDKEKNGVFTRVFIKEMQKPGLSIDRIARNVRSQVVELAKSVKHDQVPAIYDQVIGEFYFRP